MGISIYLTFSVTEPLVSPARDCRSAWGRFAGEGCVGMQDGHGTGTAGPMERMATVVGQMVARSCFCK